MILFQLIFFIKKRILYSCDKLFCWQDFAQFVIQLIQKINDLTVE